MQGFSRDKQIEANPRTVVRDKKDGLGRVDRQEAFHVRVQVEEARIEVWRSGNLRARDAVDVGAVLKELA